MLAYELRDMVQDLIDSYGEDVEIKLATQPSWPFENEIDDLVVADEDLEGDAEGKYDDPDGFDPYAKPIENPVGYLLEGRQIGYLPSYARTYIKYNANGEWTEMR